MKSTELITGSWVELNGEPSKIIELNRTFAKVERYWKNTDKVFCVDTTCVSLLQGIPLTEEILFKNFNTGNFYQVENDGDLIDVIDYKIKGLVIRYTSEDCRFYIVIDKFYKCKELGCIFYVHQLQQWLNILEIEKEIVL